jgi:hypothetical protein
MTKRPNLFKCATSELSQDGFFAWMIQWADESYRGLNEGLVSCAQDFVRYLISKQLPSYKKTITKSVCGRQWDNIDIWAEINDDIFIIVEDKTYTGEHSNQLERYIETANKYCVEKKYTLVCIYLKTGTEAKSFLEQVVEKGFAVVERKDLLGKFLPYKNKINSDIFSDFVEKIQEQEDRENSFETELIKNWHWDSWIGFYRYLESQIDVRGWNYVPNQSGGFMGLWWPYHIWKTAHVYLQIEKGKLCFKIGEVYENRKELRNELHSIIMSNAEKENKHEIIKKPQRFGNGLSMTVAVVNQEDWLGPNDAKIDKNNVVNKLKEYELFLEKCVNV